MTLQENTFVVMGVSGVGKTSAARVLADALGGDYVEADEFHPPENIAAMSAGVPLNDAMRAPWLTALGRHVAQMHAARGSRPVIVACSALKRAYRDILRDEIGAVCFVYLHAPRDLIAARMAARKDHYMPPSLLDSQFAALEPPGTQERFIPIDVSGSREDVAKALRAAVGA